MRILVLGAGVIGTTTAWYLAAAGHEVAVIDRQPAAGMETSRGSLGLHSVSHPEPWAAPGMRTRVLRAIIGRDHPFRIPPRVDPALWRWTIAFLRECRGDKFVHNLRQLAALGAYSRVQMRDLRQQTGLACDHRGEGVLHFYTGPKALHSAAQANALLAEYGIERRIVDREQAVRLEPTLAALGDRLVGASIGEDDETGDVHKFTRELARLSAENGVHFHYATRIVGVVREGRRLAGVQVRPLVGLSPQTRTLTADVFVLAAGPQSATIARRAGIRIPMQPAKGLSVTVPIRRPDRLPVRGLWDDAASIGFARLGERLRIGGTVVFAGDNLDLDQHAIGRLLARGRDLFPEACDWHKADGWAGLRPALPSGVPLVGRTGLDNLFVNTGHGGLGYTLAAGSARALVDIVGGQRPAIPFGFSGTDD